MQQSLRDASPFLVKYDSRDKQLKALLQRCDGWPMVSAIETSEPIDALAERLAAWCIVSADGQHFNVRFADTRCLPRILKILYPSQVERLVGPALYWLYMERDGRWCQVGFSGSNRPATHASSLDAKQFAAFVDGSAEDELMEILDHRRHAVFQHPSRSYALLVAAHSAAKRKNLSDRETVDWCEWYWQLDRMEDDESTAVMLDKWHKESSGEKDD